MTTVEETDVIVLGLGPGGEDVAGRLAAAGRDVVGIDRLLVGGECPYWGCVPSKMMIRAANLLNEARRIPGMAGSSEVTPDWAPVAARIRDEATDDWDDRVAVERLEGKGGRFVRGHGRLAGPGRVEVEGRTFQARTGVVIATGTRPSIPPIEGLEGLSYWTNHEAIEVKELPASLVVLGGGAVGVELAQVFATFGVQVSVVEALDRLVPLEEPEAGDLLRQVFVEEGIEVFVGARASRVRQEGETYVLELEGGPVVTGEQLLVAAGRRVDLGELGVDTVGIDPNARSLPVDDRLSAGPGLWGVGDVTGVGAFTHIAMYQADLVVRAILGEDPGPAEYHALPRVTFTHPEIGSVGLGEAAARARGLRVRTGSTQIPSTARGWIHKTGNAGFIKLVEDRDAGVLVGATSAGPAGGEVLGMLTLAVHERVPVDRLAAMIYAYPTFHRGVQDALRDLRSA